MSERIFEVVACRGDDRHTGRLVRGGEHGRATLEFDGPQGPLSVTGIDTLEALFKLRTALEADGWLLAVQGARLNAKASGMLRDMGDGNQVYLMAEAPGPYPTADTLAPAEPEDVGTIARQREYVRALLERNQAARSARAQRDGGEGGA